jgi:hypothetical protein
VISNRFTRGNFKKSSVPSYVAYHGNDMIDATGTRTNDPFEVFGGGTGGATSQIH